MCLSNPYETSLPAVPHARHAAPRRILHPIVKDCALRTCLSAIDSRCWTLKEKERCSLCWLNGFSALLALIIVSRIVPGFHVTGLGPALFASLVIGLLNATVGLFLKIITFPLSILTLGLFLLVINAMMIELASGIVHGFSVHGFWPAFVGGIVLSLLGMLIRAVVKD